MAYNTQYRIQWDNETNHRIIIDLMEKDSVAPVSVQEYAATSVQITANASEESKLAAIFGRELVMTFDMRETDIDYWDDFVNAEHDTWMVVATLDGEYIFHGFVIPDEGAVPFQDRPYDATIRATDCLGLLKQIPLVDFNGNQMEGEYTISSFLGCALYRTGLDLEIKVYDNFYHPFMLTRADDPKWDFISQTKLEARSFQKDATTFISCYDALEFICKDAFRFGYDKGQWVMKRLGMFQHNPGPIYYTVYSSNLVSQVGFTDVGTHTLVGKNDVVYAINEDQVKTVKFANKSVKTIFNYTPWPELPKNNKFERGDLLPLLSGPGYAAYEIDGWTFGGFTGGADTSALPGLNATTKRAYRLSTYNAFNIEIDRNVVLEQTPSDNNSVLLSEGMPVIAGDKIVINFDRRLSYAGTGNSQVAMIWVQAPSGQRRFIGSQNTTQMSPYYWVSNTATRVTKNYTTGENFNQWSSFIIDPPEIPISGKLYIGLLTTGISNSLAYFKNFSVEYLPFVAGGYIQVIADYWIRSQNKNYPDVYESEISLSDNDHKIFKGAILRLDNAEPTTPQWFRLGVTESRHYKELVNIALYNLLYRRFWNIEGSFTGLNICAENATTTFFPLSLFSTYKFNDISPEERYFMLNGPVTMDLLSGNFTAQFSEVNMVAPGATELVQSLESFLQSIVNAINATTATDWDSAGGAPAAGTIQFPPAAMVSPSTSNGIRVHMNDADNMLATVTAGGAGNSPSVTTVYNADVGPYRWIEFQIGTDIATGNEFTFTAYGHDVVVAVEGSSLLPSADGSQMGDNYSFNYVFK